MVSLDDVRTPALVVDRAALERNVAAVARRTRAAVFGGVLAFGGHAYGARDLAGVRAAADDEQAAVRATAAAVEALGADRLTGRAPGFGLVLGHPELCVERVYEEHAIVTAPGPVDVPLGARLRVVPNHACTAANLHARMLVTADGARAESWTVGAREWDPLTATEDPRCHESTS